MVEKMKSNKIVFITLLGLCAAAMIFGVKNILWARKQESISITPEEVFEVFEEAGYEIRNIEVVNEGDMGPLGGQKQGYKLDLIAKGESYLLFVEDFGEWEKAKSAAKRMNEMDDRMHGGYCSAFYYGPVGVVLCPSDKGLDARLLDALMWKEIIGY